MVKHLSRVIKKTRLGAQKNYKLLTDIKNKTEEHCEQIVVDTFNDLDETGTFLGKCKMRKEEKTCTFQRYII